MTAVCLEDVIIGRKQILLTLTASIALTLPSSFLLYWMIDGIVLISIISPHCMEFNCKIFVFIDFDVLTINKNYKTEKLLELDSLSKGLLHLSILAHDSAQIVFTQDENFRSGYMVVLGGWDGYIKSVIRHCPHITDSDYPRDCKEFDEKVILKM
jgi:hypothetical protein